MDQGFLQKSIKGKARIRCVISIVVFCVMALILFFSRQYINALVNGYTPLANIMDAKAMYESGDRYVILNAPYIYDTGYTVVTSTETYGVEVNKETTSFYVLAETEQGYMLAEIPYKYYDDENFSFENVSLKGTLTNLSDDSELREYTVSQLAALFEVSPGDITDEILSPVYLDTTRTDLTPQVCGLIGLAALVFFFINLRVLINYQADKSYQSLDKLGDASEIEEIINREYGNPSQYLITQSKKDFVFESYIIAGSSGVAIRPTRDLIWAYYLSIKNRGAKTHLIVLSFKNGFNETRFKVKNEAEAQRILNDLTEKLPIICGYSKELSNLYKKDPEAFAELCANKTAPNETVSSNM